MKKIGYWGHPHPDKIKEVKEKYKGYEFLDLDVDYGAPNSGLVPETCCKIIRNIINNALFYKSDMELILAAIGEDKCDSGRFASLILKDLGFNILDTKFEKYDNSELYLPISTSTLPVSGKINLIMDGVIEKQNLDLTPCVPTHGFWGVPPNDFSFLDIFPDTTHIYGWVRAVEAKRPADMELEMFVDENVPTVFFAQAFCSKIQLAKYLAKKHGGLFIDIDDKVNNSIKAKIEAFIRLG